MKTTAKTRLNLISNQQLSRANKVKNTFLKEVLRRSLCCIKEMDTQGLFNGTSAEETAAKIVPITDFEISLIITNDRVIRQINKEFRDVDSATDVISFSQIEDIQEMIRYPGEPLLIGEIVVSMDTAIRQAENAGVSLRHMLAWLLCHGVLHLVGFDHPTDETRSVMGLAEGKILKALGFGRIPDLEEMHTPKQ